MWQPISIHKVFKSFSDWKSLIVKFATCFIIFFQIKCNIIHLVSFSFFLFTGIAAADNPDLSLLLQWQPYLNNFPQDPETWLKPIHFVGIILLRTKK